MICLPYMRLRQSACASHMPHGSLHTGPAGKVNRGRNCGCSVCCDELVVFVGEAHQHTIAVLIDAQDTESCLLK